MRWTSFALTLFRCGSLAGCIVPLVVEMHWSTTPEDCTWAESMSTCQSFPVDNWSSSLSAARWAWIPICQILLIVVERLSARRKPMVASTISLAIESCLWAFVFIWWLFAIHSSGPGLRLFCAMHSAAFLFTGLQWVSDAIENENPRNASDIEVDAHARDDRQELSQKKHQLES